jgi:integrase
MHTWEGSVAAWSVALRAAGRAETTIATRRDHLERTGRALGGGPWTVSGVELVTYVGSQTWARETRRSVRASLRGFYGWGAAGGWVDSDPSLELPAVRPSAPRPRPAPEAAYRAALAAADPRTRLILRLAGEMGLRRAEIAQIHARDVVEDLLGASLLVHGKGERMRMVPMPPALALELVAAAGGGFAFPGDDGGHLSPRWVGKLSSRVMPDGYTLHTLRHRFATLAYGVERDLLVVQSLLGHSSPETTRRYVATDGDRLRRTVLAVAV